MRSDNSDDGLNVVATALQYGTYAHVILLNYR
jgi:hypothetical protein